MCMTLGYFFTNNVLIIPYLREFEKSGIFSFASFSPVSDVGAVGNLEQIHQYPPISAVVRMA